MKVINRLAAASLLLCLPAAAVWAQDSAPAAPEAAPTTGPSDIVVEGEKPKRVCETRASTGSIMPRRVCRTVEQAAADQRDAQRTIEALNRNQEALQTAQRNRALRGEAQP